MSSLAIFLQQLELALRLHAAVPSIEFETAYAHAEAALVSQTEAVPAELLLGIAFVESRFDPTALSRIEGGRRTAGRYPPTTPPARLDPRGALYCGPLQTFARSWSVCLGMRDLMTAYAAGVAELQQWLRDRRVRGDPVRALAGHGCGNHGVTTGSCNGYPRRVLGIAHKIRNADDPRSRASRRAVANT